MTRHRKLIVEEMLGQPSGVCPMLFVGLGGAGCRMVARVARHLRRRPDFRERLRDLVKVAMVDTNVHDLESYREIADATFLISDFEKESYANLASGKRFLEADDYFTQWVPQDYRFRAGDTAGAGQIRIESRLGVYYQMKHKDFVPRFRRLLEDLKSHEHGHRRLDSDEIRIVLCYSVAGGTGSGSHLPVAYLLRDQAADLGRPTVIGVAVLPAVFEDAVGVNKDGIFANGYAALKETEHLMKLGAPDSRFYPEDGLELHYDPTDTSKTRVHTRPFDFLYLVDKPESFSVPDPVAAAADGLYLQFFSPLYGTQLSDYDNYTQYQRFLVPDDFEERGIPGFSTFYGSFGCAVLLVPVAGLVEYCSQAAALSLLRSSFLGEIPGDPTYEPVRIAGESFYQVQEHDDEDARIYGVAEIAEQPQKARRDRLYDRLFARRVRLLAHCEHRAEKDGRFRGLFRHGHFLGTVPKRDGSFVYDPENRVEEIRREKELVGGRLEVSIGGILLPAVAGLPGEEPGLLLRAQQAIRDFDPPRPRRDMRVSELQGRAASWRDDFAREGLRRLREGYRDGTQEVPGLDELVELDFLRRGAGQVDLAAKRYAVLCLLEAVDWQQDPDPEPDPDYDVQGKKPGAKVKPGDELIDHVVEQARAKARVDVRREMLAQLGALEEALRDFADEMRELERGSIFLERDYGRKLERLRYQGDESANRYVLDAEALQGEDGRRFWDFYFEDQVAGLPELSLGHPRVQQILGDSVIDLSRQSDRAFGTSRLEKLFGALRDHAHGVLASRIGGDPHAPDPHRRQGLTLSEALEAELIYRALYRSHAEEVKGEGEKAVRRLLAEYRALPEEEQIDFGAPEHQGYLKDKIRRVVQEKASLLCVYDRSRDQHGGVRPDHVFLAAIGEDFANAHIEEALRSADIAGLQWVSGHGLDPKEVVFYRAVLNVPVYTFGRLDRLKHYYDAFRGQKRRSKMLHIDRSWEGDRLSDLDPDTLKEEHRQILVRDRIIDFTALLRTAHPLLGDAANCILRRQGRYLLLRPDLRRVPESLENGFTCLGTTLAEAVERLPAVLDAEQMTFADYRESLHGIRHGMAPALLAEVCRLPFEWRRQYEDLSSHYGSSRSVRQRERLRDLGESYQRLREALGSLLDELRNRQLESRTQSEDFSVHARSLDPEQAEDALAQSIRILSAFVERWARIAGEEGLPKAVPDSFRSLFRPLDSQELGAILGRFESGRPGGLDDGGLDDGGLDEPEGWSDERV